MTDPLDAELDTLFQLPPADLVQARNALADQLKKAGDREGAARIKSLKRPTPAAWAINQVWFREARLLERARAAALQLRELHARDGVDARQLSAAVEAQRSAIQAVVDAATRHAHDAGITAGPAQERKVFTTLQGWLAGAGDELPGRMTHDLEPSGFDAVAAVGVPAPLRSEVPASAPTADAPRPPDVHVQARELAGRRVAEQKQRAEAALARVEQSRAKHAAAEAELHRAKLEVEDAERALADRRARFDAKKTATLATEQALREAERLRDAAEADLSRARELLASLPRL